MRKSTIWILGIVMGASFLSLLYLQVKYIEEMVRMRNEQFDVSVKRSLYQVSKNVEFDETQRWLIKDVSEEEQRIAQYSGSSIQTEDIVQQQFMHQMDSSGNAFSSFELKTIRTRPSDLPKAMISKRHGSKTIPQTSKSLSDAVKNRYMYQRFLLDEVVWQMIHQTSDQDIEKRVNFRNLDQYLKSEFLNNGLELNYHFIVIDRSGREVYRCPDYEKKGSEGAYVQPLFPNDPPSKMSLVKVHFPAKRDYIFDSVSFMIPSTIFTAILLLTFIFTIYVVFRQKKLTEMKNDFVNNMTHEFKTPISSISLAAQMLKDPSVSKSPSLFQHLCNVINDETKRLRFQVEKVLQMSMFDKQATMLKKKELDANVIIHGVVETFNLKVAQNHGELLAFLDAENGIISADEMHFTNVIFNLMDNAVKYKNPEKDLKLTVRTWNESDKLIIVIQDNGIGIKKDDVKKVFDKFYRVHTGNLHDVKGFGLGLAYVKKIVEEHHGTIRAESELNVGTKFIIALPLLK